MGAQRPAADPTTLTFESTVTEIDGDSIALDETYFYAESGGQPADRGTIDGIDVLDVQLHEGTVWHTLESVEALEHGETVTGEVDPAFRRYCMAAHTASHAVYGAARQHFDQLGYGGFEITPSKVRLDLETPTPIDDEEMIELERLTNQVIWEDRAVTWSEWSTEEVNGRDDIAFNVATDVIETDDTVRIVEIADWDLAACGGTHMSATGDIGEITMADRSNPGEGQTRLEFVVGMDRIAQRHQEKQTAWAAKRQLGVPIEEIPHRISKLEDERSDLEARVTAMEESVIAAGLSGPSARSFDRNGATWIITSIDDVDTNTVSSVLDEMAGDIGDVLVVATGQHRSQVIAVSQADIPATDVVDATLQTFDGGGGGGSSQKAQAGGIDADPGEIVDSLTERYDAN